MTPPPADASTPICAWTDLPAITGGAFLAATPAGTLCGVVTDSRQPIAPGQLFLALRGERFDGHAFLAAAADQGATALCVEAIDATAAAAFAAHGVAVLQVADTLAAYQAIARHHRQTLAPTLVAITGSSGKTSTKTIVAAVLAAAWPDAVLSTAANTNNQVGVPQNILRLRPHHRAAVIEMGTNGPGEIAPLSRCGRPDIAVLTNVGPVHLDGLGSIDGVAAEKATIFTGLDPATGWAIVARSLAEHPAVAPHLPAGRTLTFGPEADADIRVQWLGGDLQQGRFRIHRAHAAPLDLRLPVAGAHQAANTAVAVAVAQILDLPDAIIQPGLDAVQLPGMRMRLSTHAGVTWLNDAYNANPDSVAALIHLLADIYTPPTPQPESTQAATAKPTPNAPSPHQPTPQPDVTTPQSGTCAQRKTQTASRGPGGCTSPWRGEGAEPLEPPRPPLHLVLGDMLELGPDELRIHADTLALAREALPQATIHTLGPRYAAAAPGIRDIDSHTDPDTLRPLLHAIPAPALIVLKASRGLALERLLPTT